MRTYRQQSTSQVDNARSFDNRMESILHATLLLIAAPAVSAFRFPIQSGYRPTGYWGQPPRSMNPQTHIYQHAQVSQSSSEETQVNIKLWNDFNNHNSISLVDYDQPTQSNSSLSSDETRRWLHWMSSGHAAPRSAIEEAQYDGESRRSSDRYASKDWWHNTVNLRHSAILRSILFPLLSMTGWSLLITCIYRSLLHHGNASLAAKMCIPSGPHSLTVSALGLLLVFRTNSAYQRFSEGRKIWEQILSTSRDLSRLSKLYEDDIGIAKLRRVQRLLAAFPY